ncbi:hypothetical protein N0V93_001985 [Gnomoniopsis smithogilvyi]|uniref:Uncharacterized protein n=1 Tax=Gnomoniopsis smithogilvyi TaxID=1191159 RepID=A0A9W8Z317_9PEZI|nr:hypothetical protein N0V93_001985 [Gnomoniopsis smithogilvyi]
MASPAPFSCASMHLMRVFGIAVSGEDNKHPSAGQVSLSGLSPYRVTSDLIFALARLLALGKSLPHQWFIAIVFGPNTVPPPRSYTVVPTVIDQD